LEDERRQGGEFKEQAEKSNGRVKQLRRQMDEQVCNLLILKFSIFSHFECTW
jgi:hypothetical protein